MELNVKRLIYTSCLVYPSFPSIFFDDVHGIHNGNETMPYVHSPNDHYSVTKAEGEALVIKANGTNGLLTCYIRLSSIFGPGDRLSMSSLVAAARKGESKRGVSYSEIEGAEDIGFSSSFEVFYGRRRNVTNNMVRHQRAWELCSMTWNGDSSRSENPQSKWISGSQGMALYAYLDNSNMQCQWIIKANNSREKEEVQKVSTRDT
ncbi:hypothetical protein JHK85_009919 [Glycine max]|nr:hypothetical protein JHK85_009919 [Glycine max]